MCLHNGIDWGELCTAPISKSDSVIVLHKLQTAGETFTLSLCSTTTIKRKTPLLLNYSISYQPLLQHHSSSFNFSPLLSLRFSISSHSLSAVHSSSRFIKSRQRSLVRPAPLCVNQAHLLRSNSVSVVPVAPPPELLSISL